MSPAAGAGQYAIARSRRMRSSMGGWVLNKLASQLPRSGFTIPRCAVAGPAESGMRLVAAPIVSSADARDPGGVGAAAGGEGVRRVARDQIDARHRHVRARRQLAHDAEEVGCVLLAELAGAVGREHDPVREPVAAEVHHRGKDETEHEPLHAADELADPHQEPGQQAEQQRRLESIRHAATPSLDGGDGGLFEVRQERPERSYPATLVSGSPLVKANRRAHAAITRAAGRAASGIPSGPPPRAPSPTRRPASGRQRRGSVGPKSTTPDAPTAPARWLTPLSLPR